MLTEQLEKTVRKTRTTKTYAFISIQINSVMLKFNTYIKLLFHNKPVSVICKRMVKA